MSPKHKKILQELFTFSCQVTENTTGLCVGLGPYNTKRRKAVTLCWWIQVKECTYYVYSPLIKRVIASDTANIFHSHHTQRLVLWCGPCSTQRQARELISDPDLAANARLLSINRTQSRVVIGLLTGHNTLRRHLYIMGLSNNPTCRKCGTEEETSVHILCECEAMASLRNAYLGSFFVDPEDIRKLSAGALWNFAKRTGLI